MDTRVWTLIFLAFVAVAIPRGPAMYAEDQVRIVPDASG